MPSRPNVASAFQTNVKKIVTLKHAREKDLRRRMNIPHLIVACDIITELLIFVRGQTFKLALLAKVSLSQREATSGFRKRSSCG